jgi:aminoglycoside/choline kinase family phosphotransferase
LIPSEFPGLADLARRSRYEPVAVEVLPGDVGRRRYLRFTLADGSTVLGVVYPPEEESARRRWLAARAALGGHVRVPALFAEDGLGNQVLEDFGSEDLASLLSSRPSERSLWLERATAVAAAIAGITDPRINEPFDPDFFFRELSLAREAVFDLWLAAPLSPEEHALHDEWARGLAREIADHPRALCHRDFHGNNLFPVGDRVAAIDFQDLKSGPDAYDVASLLWERTTLEWMERGEAEKAVGAFTRLRGVEPDAFGRRLDRVLLQRAWKVCGTFARAVAQGRGETYRRYLPRELALVRRLLAGEDRFRGVFESRLAPLC